MTPSPTRIAVAGDDQIAVRKATIRRCLRAVLEGESQTLTANLDENGVDVGALICELTAELPPGSLAIERLSAAFDRGGLSDKVVARLSATDAALQVTSARIVGALRMERAIPWLTPLLSVSEQTVRNAAARALGRIAGARSAEVLMGAIERAGPSRTLVVELARAAPDLFLESELTRRRGSAATCGAAAAAGLRRRRPAVGPLVALLATGSGRERVVSCRALGWIGARNAVPAITAALEDSEPKVRASAAKALIALLGNAAIWPSKTTRLQVAG